MSLHPRNRHQGHYDFPVLIKSCPELAPFVAPAPHGQPSINFSNPDAVKTLNRALLSHYYGLRNWDIPAGYLCPPIPGRADYIHSIADLLSDGKPAAIPKGPQVRGLDIGVGANCIYPIIGQGEYAWRFVGTETDQMALESAKRIVAANSKLTPAVELRIQPAKTAAFKGVIKPGESFDFTICNPPFHASAEEAMEGSKRKVNNLARNSRAPKGKSLVPILNFGGQSNELWCDGGEVTFICRMIEESTQFAENIRWFTSLVSKESTLHAIHETFGKLKRDGHAVTSKTIPLSQGQKQSRVVAWTFAN